MNLKKIIFIIILFFNINAFAASDLLGPFTTKDGKILDKDGHVVTLHGVSWFGFNTNKHVLHGLWSADFNTMLMQIKNLGFNAVRIPIQFDFVLNNAIKPTDIKTDCSGPHSCNMNIPQDSAIHTLQWVVEQFTHEGVYVLLDDHYEDTTFMNQQNWIKGWKTIATMFKDNSLVGYDLYNEPDKYGIKWQAESNKPALADAYFAAIKEIDTIDPNKLIFIEGTGQLGIESTWGDGFATDSKTLQSRMSNPNDFFTKLFSEKWINQIVISPHVYGPDGTDNTGPDESNKDHAFVVWSRLFGYLNNNFLSINNTSQNGFCIHQSCHVFPVVVGEFGGKFSDSDPYHQKDVAINTNLAAFLNRLDPASSWFYWDWNPNSGNTGGILQNDWKTVDCNKVAFLKTYLGLKPDNLAHHKS